MYKFVASFNVAKFLVKVYLADVNKYTGQMRPQDVENCCKNLILKSLMYCNHV